MKTHLLLILCCIAFTSCKEPKKNYSVTLAKGTKTSLNEKGATIATRFKVPNGFSRVTPQPNTFEAYLQNFKLKPHGVKVHLYNGDIKHRQDVHAAVLDISVGDRDLQQCADATMRLRAEYLYGQKRYNDIGFNFTNGFHVAYVKWRQGYRIKVKGNKVSWVKTNNESTSYTSFKKYMQYIFMYAGTLSLEKEMRKVDVKDAKIGDVFIQGGSPGHAVIIVDMVKNKEGETLVLLAQSYMPAQEIHILKNFNKSSWSPWYSLKDMKTLKTPEWTFSKNDLRRF